MSKTSFIAGITHSLSGLSTSGSVSRTLNEQQFIALSVTIGDEEETLPLGEVVAARYVFIKNISGDDLLVGTATGSYPFRLKEKDPCLLPLDTDGKLFEESTIACVADVAGSLNRKYFDMADNAGPLRVWFSTESEVTAVAASAAITYGAVALATTASGTITFSALSSLPAYPQKTYFGLTAMPVDGNTMTIGGKTYTWRTTVATTADEVELGANLTSCMSALKDAINANPITSGILWGSATTTNAQFSASIVANASDIYDPGDNDYPFGDDEALLLTAKTPGVTGYTATATTAFENITTPGTSANAGPVLATRQISHFGLLHVPNDGATTTIGGVTYTWRTTLTGAPNEVLTDASEDGAPLPILVSRLKDAINAYSYTRGVSYSYDTIKNPQVSAVVVSSATEYKPPGYVLPNIYTNYCVIKLTAEVKGSAGAFLPAAGSFFLQDKVAVDGSSIVVNDVTLLMAHPDSDPFGPYEFSSFYDLEDKLNNVPGINASRAGLVITVTAATAGTEGNAIDLTAAGAGISVSGSGFLTGGTNTTTFTVDTTTFTFASTPTGNQFSTSAGLTALINAMTSVNATLSTGVITITAATAGTGGNSINAYKGAGPGLLAGGVNASGSPATPTGGRLLRVPITTGSTASQVASSLDTALDADSFSTTISTNTVVATDNISGIRTPITDVDSGFTVSRTVSATSQFVVFLKSDGVSQVLIGVSPN